LCGRRAPRAALAGLLAGSADSQPADRPKLGQDSGWWGALLLAAPALAAAVAPSFERQPAGRAAKPPASWASAAA